MFSDNDVIDSRVRNAYMSMCESVANQSKPLRRKAILIHGYNDDNGAAICNLWRGFLRQTYGGAWDNDEIIDLYPDETLDFEDFQKNFKELTRNSDYNIIVFTGGHVYEKGELPWDDIKLTMNGVNPFSLNEINPESTRGGLIIINTYENVDNPQNYTMDDPKNMIGGYDSVKQSFRSAYDSAVLNCEKGLISIRSNGYQHLSKDLIELAEKNWESSKNRTMSIRELWKLYEKAEPDDKLCSTYHEGRRLNALPITVRM